MGDNRKIISLITITPEMIEVGYRVLCNSGITDECLEADRLLVEEIYLAMEAYRIRSRALKDKSHCSVGRIRRIDP
jgi:hypothetical protein